MSLKFSPVFLLIFIIILPQATPTSLLRYINIPRLIVNMTDMPKAKTHFSSYTNLSLIVQPNALTFIKSFKNRTHFCTYQCNTMINLPCLIVYQCTSHMRDLLAFVIFPTIIGLMTAYCCLKPGKWSFLCWFRYFSFITGIKIFVWVFSKIRKCCIQCEIDDKKEIQDLIQGPQTEDRLKVSQKK